MAVYFSASSFTRNYFIYFKNGKTPAQFYEARAVRDTLRKKIYVISFTRVNLA